MKKFLKKHKLSNIIIAGYMLLIVVLLAILSVDKTTNITMQSHYQQLLDSKNQVIQVEKMQLHARRFSLYIMEMLIQKDYFETDRLNLRFQIEAISFGKARNKLLTYTLSEEVASLLKLQKKHTAENEIAQFKVVDLIFLEDYPTATKLLLHRAFPTQTQLLLNLKKASALLKDNEKKSLLNYQKLVKSAQLKQMSLQTTFLLLLIILSIFSYLQVRKQEKINTYENAVDAHILAEVADYIALVDKKGNIIRANPKCQRIIQELPNNVNLTNLWEILGELTDNNAYESLQNIFTDLEEKGVWKNELRLHAKQPFYGLCEVKNFKSDKVENAVYLMVISDITSITEAHKLIETQANQDAVTGIANRHYFQHQVAHCVNTGYPFLLLYIDLDNFKKVNDTLGHESGDDLLKNVSHRLQNILLENAKENFTLARIGGDEFAVILSSRHENLHEMSQKISDLICSKLKANFVIHEQIVKIGSSIGIAIFPEHSNTITGIMRCADLAMYESKLNGKNRFTMFNDTLDQKIHQQIVLENKIDKALMTQEFILHFQPQYHLKTNRLIGLEALIRWQSPTGFISPAEFIPFAEQQGMIQRIDKYVIKTACEHIANWRKQGIILGDIKLAINISSQELNDKDFFNYLMKEMKRNQVDSSNIEIEVTEYTIVENLDNKNSESQTILESLKNAGIYISIDDFGTGYSSLTYLKEMDVDRLKIDYSFVKNIAESDDDVAIVEAIIILGHRMGVKVIAEGIETHQQLAILKELGCEEGQGFLLDKPKGIKEITTLLKGYQKLEKT